jgi:hypothetical protein
MSTKKKAVKKEVYVDDFSVSYGYNASDPDSIDKMLNPENYTEEELMYDYQGFRI